MHSCAQCLSIYPDTNWSTQPNLFYPWGMNSLTRLAKERSTLLRVWIQLKHWMIFFLLGHKSVRRYHPWYSSSQLIHLSLNAQKPEGRYVKMKGCQKDKFSRTTGLAKRHERKGGFFSVSYQCQLINLKCVKPCQCKTVTRGFHLPVHDETRIDWTQH